MNSNAVVMILGNKIDKENKEITKLHLDKYMTMNKDKSERQFLLFDTSARTGFQVEESFEKLAEKIFERYKTFGHITSGHITSNSNSKISMLIHKDTGRLSIRPEIKDNEVPYNY